MGGQKGALRAGVEDLAALALEALEAWETALASCEDPLLGGVGPCDEWGRGDEVLGWVMMLGLDLVLASLRGQGTVSTWRLLLLY